MKYAVALFLSMILAFWGYSRGDIAELGEWLFVFVSGVVFLFVVQLCDLLEKSESQLKDYQDKDFKLTDYWTLAKKDFLRESVMKGHDIERMCDSLGHTEHSVRGKLVGMKLYQHYLEIQDDRGPARFEKWRKIAKRIGKVVPIGATIASAKFEYDRQEPVGEPPDWRYISALVEHRHDPRIEFCQSFARNLKSRLPDPNTRHDLVKHVAAFLNSAGGQILVGISASGYVVGLFEDDFQTPRHYKDRLISELKSALGTGVLNHVELNFVRWGSEDLLLVTARKSTKKIVCQHKKYNEWAGRPRTDQIVYVRLNGSSKEVVSNV